VNSNKPKPELIYMEFCNEYLLKNQVKEINITKDRRSTVFNYKAEITMIDDKKF
jgi:CRISPR/Cas system-associated exonuclease Cas4 (RecB family)